MSDFENGKTTGEKKLEQIAQGPFFDFAKPYLDFISKEKIFNIVYVVMAVVNLLLPFAILFSAINAGILKAGVKYVIAFILVWLVIAFACWIGFQLWWERRNNISTIAISEFIVTPIFSQIIQTFGEWIGTLIGIIGAGSGLIASIILGKDAAYLFSALGLGAMNSGLMMIIIGPVTGFFIIIISRFLAEQLRLLACLVNNTKEIATNLKK